MHRARVPEHGSGRLGGASSRGAATHRGMTRPAEEDPIWDVAHSGSGGRTSGCRWWWRLGLPTQARALWVGLRRAVWIKERGKTEHVI